MTLKDKRIEWKLRFDAWKESGLSIAKWCREHKLNEPQMYYWVQKFEREIKSPDQETSDTQWLTVDMKDEPAQISSQEPVFIHFGTISVEVRPGANMGLLSDVVQILQNQC
ncbi:hypothetical protein CFK37_19725 [Virgibacillus phasianinus]|uniref:Transposase n=1 Tax=Virgibacillus phasianinus TaxID=2017483 RepID=A0A220U857_9BACI|nr:transposase [Virgibacillus phasianinus]ASK63889.1 hypothetical protein CFK37_17855 [Virgibacillus phasianinus]ASK64212.1 hypothetical protein CFK37_19710 [Virgibacillus phasianinus]ASK64215.1 hypothetical protein CFK37_19725 [Virgibacillus phasianinus]